ncbi:uncharacterized protein [Aquarana catesbeiana]|uniref:uncharacterized protein n=1 Tax=Aquarana catesbeiana TaxID=8400 RepID=UPI003CCA4C39
MPWLQAHNPTINWVTGEITFSSQYCQQFCTLKDSGESPALLCLNTDSELFQAVPKVYHDFLDVFSKKGAETLPPHRAYDCPIELLPGAEVPFGRIFPLTELEQGALKAYIDENLEKGFIRPSTSPAGAGIFFVEKKDHSLRPCIDYRELNKITVKNRYPLPLLPELFQRLGTATIFTKLDLRGAYNLVRIRKGDEWKTAFRTRFGHFEYMVMPFGLCNAPATFQYFINDVFRDYLDLFVIVYLDDILIFSSSLESHRRHVKCVLARLRLHGLYAKAEKCEFEQESIPFLGLIISVEGIKMDPHKVAAILDWPAPTDKKGVQRFIGFANFYRKFIKGFSAIIEPITQLTKQGVRFHWSPEAQSAFESLKRLFTSAAVLKHPDSSLPFVLEVDASESAVGAILSQRQGTKALLYPVAFFSRKLSSAERNYDVGDRELLAIKSALEEWRYLLEGAAHPILIYTDHKNLEYLKSAKRLRPRQARWALFFSRFSFHVTYRPGSKNIKPDALSRMFHKPQETSPPDTILSPGNFFLLQEDLLSRIKQASVGLVPAMRTKLQEKDGLLWFGSKIFVPEGLRVTILELCHDHALAGHFGVTKTADLVLRTFWWPQVPKDCKKYVESCTICARNKVSRTRAWGLLKPLPVPDRPWKMLSIDLIVELPPAEGHTAIFVVETMTKSQERNKITFNRKRRGESLLEPGDLVWLSTVNLKLTCPSKKLGPKFLGPFPVKRKINEVAFELELPDSLRIHPVFHVSLLKPSVSNPFPERNLNPPDPVIVDGAEEFEIEAILDCRKRNNQAQFLIKWKGWLGSPQCDTAPHPKNLMIKPERREYRDYDGARENTMYSKILFKKAEFDKFRFVKDKQLFARKLMYKVIFDKTTVAPTVASVPDNSVPTAAEIQAIEDLLTLLEEGGTEDECEWQFDDHGIVASGVSFPPPLSFKPKSTNFPNLSMNPNIWAFVEQISKTIKDTDFSISCPSNLSGAQKQALKSLQNHPGLVIKPADKGGNVVVMDVAVYEIMCRDILDNPDWYRPISRTLIENYAREYYELIFSAYQKGIIDINTWKFLNVKDARIPTFYALPKLHKSLKNPPGRPIISGCSSLTENASALVDKYLSPHVQALPSYVQDTVHLLRIFDNLKLPKNTWMVALDVESLYNTIPHGTGIEVISKSLQDRGPNSEAYNQFVVDLLNFILTHILPDHQELLCLDVISSPLFPIILGMPWLQFHNPQINWVTSQVIFQSFYCLQNCLKSSHQVLPVIGCLKSVSETQKLVPSVYHDFLDMFDKQKADILPPHRVYDCPMELLPGAEIPFVMIFPLSEPELLVLEEYIN